jgi:agmatine deiminase
MSDGHGTAFSSNLVLEENATGGGWNNNLTEADIDSIMKHYMGIKRYVKMETLPYDGIHHIDMHMKLLDEETLLIGEYPQGVSDGPQIEANIQYIQDNFLTCFGRPYKIIRIPQPPSTSGNYPGSQWGNGYYRTYTNALILNGIVLVPSYYEAYDTTALRIWKEAMPGYQVYQLDCNNIIPQSGTIHCITHEIGVSDPIWISHAKLLDTYQITGTYQVDAYINTPSGVSSATLYWTIDTTAGFTATTMNDLGSGDYQAMIPAQAVGTKVFYYIEANSNSGRTVRKPLVAPNGSIMFKVLGDPVGVNEPTRSFDLFEPFPVPASDVLNVSFYLQNNTTATLTLTDVTGRNVQTLPLGSLERGLHQYTYNVSTLPTGTYFIRLNNETGNSTVRKFGVAR